MNEINNPPEFDKLWREVAKDLHKHVALIAVRFFKQSFDKGGFTDHSFISWPKRKDEEQHPVLRDQSRLRNSIHVMDNSVDNIVIGVDSSIPYAEIHNTGGTITIPVTDKFRKFCWAMFMQMSRGSAYASGLPDDILKWKFMALTKKSTLTIKIPQRQFIGESAELNKKVMDLMSEGIAKKISQQIFNT
jgi:phage gpG-like protein